MSQISLEGVLGVSPSGQLVVGERFDDATRWDVLNGAQALPTLPGWTSSEARDASADGLVIVGNRTDPSRGVRWTTSGPEEIAPLPGWSNSTLNRVTPDGKVAVGASGNTAARWTRLHGLHPCGPPEAYDAYGVSDDGWRVVGYDLTNGAFIWDPVNGRRWLDEYLLSAGASAVQGWELWRATGISGDGTVIVGQGLSPSGVAQGWMATVPAFCYPNCDGSTAAPALNVADFTCFLQKFAAGEIYGNCDNDGSLNVLDFTCFLQKYAAGCP